LNKKLIAPIILGAAVAVMLAIPISPPTQLPCTNDEGQCYESTLTRVIDGDTIKDSENNSIRFSLVAAPELSESGGQDSKAFLEALCPINSKIIIDEDDGQLQGSYGRIIAQVHCNGVSMNGEMILNNHATIDTRYCNNSEFSFEIWAKEYCD